MSYGTPAHGTPAHGTKAGAIIPLAGLDRCGWCRTPHKIIPKLWRILKPESVSNNYYLVLTIDYFINNWFI